MVGLVTLPGIPIMSACTDPPGVHIEDAGVCRIIMYHLSQYTCLLAFLAPSPKRKERQRREWGGGEKGRERGRDRREGRDEGRGERGRSREFMEIERGEGEEQRGVEKKEKACGAC